MTQVDKVAEARPAELVFAAALATACLAAFSGFHQFDAIQTGAATFLVTTGLFLATLSGRPPAPSLSRKLGMGALALAGAWAVGLLLAGPVRANWADGLAALSPLFLFALALLVFVRQRHVGRGGGWIAISLATVAIGSAGAAVLQRFGIAIPPPIPYVTPVDSWARGFADDPLSASGWFGLMILASVAAFERSSPRMRIALSAGIVCAAVGCAFTAPSLALLIPLVAVATLAVAGAIRKSPGATQAGVAGSVVLLVAIFAHPSLPDSGNSDELPVAESADFVDHLEPEFALPFPQTANGVALPSGDRRATLALANAASSLAAENPWVGFGPGALHLRVQEGLDPDSDWALAHPELTPTWSRAPVPAIRWASELGVLWLLLAVAGPFILLLRPLSMLGSSVPTAVASFLAVPAFLLLPGADTGAGAILAATALGFGIVFGSESADSPADGSRGPFGVWIVPTLATVLCLFHFQNARWSLAEAAGVQFAQAGAIEPAAQRFERATTLLTRYQSEFNAGLVGAYNTSTERDPATTAQHLQTAAILAPGSSIARFELASHFVRSMAGSVNSEEEGMEGRESSRQLLERAMVLNPNYASAGMLLAQTLVLEDQNPEAIGVLEALLARPLPPRLKLRVLAQTANVYLDIAETPQLAIPLLEQALEIETRFMNRRDLSGRLAMARLWMQTGARPAIGTEFNGDSNDDAHGSPGGDHGHTADDVQDLYAPGSRDPGAEEHGDQENGAEGHDDEGSAE
jgi:tetratricopeptide (TPR) repeat protein